MGTGLGVHRDDVAAGLGEGFQVGIDRRDHQVHVERLLGVRPQGRDNAGTDGDIGHEMPIHDVDMNIVAARRIDGADFLSQTREVGRENGWCDFHGLRHGPAPFPT